MKNKLFALIFLFLLTPPLFGQTNAPAASTNAAPASTNTVTPFQQAVADYQRRQLFSDGENVAKLTADMDALPPTPQEARKHFVMGETEFKEATSKGDFLQAAQEFYQASTNAPWLAKVWNNMAVSREKAGDFDYALNCLKVYQDFKLSGDDAQAAQDLAYKIQAEKDLAAKHAADDWAIQQQAAAAEAAKAQAAAQAAAAKQAEENSPEAQTKKLIKSLDGGVWRLEQNQTAKSDGASWRSGDGIGQVYIFIRGNEISRVAMMHVNSNGFGEPAFNGPIAYNDSTARRTPVWKTTFSSRSFDMDLHSLSFGSDTTNSKRIAISDDGQSITEETTWHYPSDSMMLKTTDVFQRLQ